MPIATFAFIGIEMVTVMAFEARNPRDLRFPSKWIAYCITATYLVIIGGYISNVEWFNPHLPKFFDQPLVTRYDSEVTTTPLDFPADSSRSGEAAVIALLQAGIKTLPNVVTLFIFYSGLSCATANLYVASRTLYGLTRHLPRRDPEHKLKSLIAWFNVLSSHKRIPIVAMITSIIVVSIWLPFLNVNTNGVSHVSLLFTSVYNVIHLLA